MKRILIYGLGVTGVSSIKALYNLGYKLSVFDDRDVEELSSVIEDLKEYDFNLYSFEEDIPLETIDLLLRSPGIPLDNPLILKAKSLGIEVISDIEMAYKIWGGENLVVITGTNGKTTTTKLVSHILDHAGVLNQVVGNIGLGILWEMYEKGLDYIYIVESSSFQLADIKEIKAKISTITNLSPDHLDWHGSFEKYKDAKLNLFKNLSQDNIITINKDDESYDFLEKLPAKKLYFSTKSEIKDGLYYKNKSIIDGINGDLYLKEDDINLVGRHNMENVMNAIQIVRSLGLSDNIIKEAIINFKSVEHRLEFVCEIQGKKYYNDSKGTNVDSTLNAINSFDESLVLIAGGYDKNISFDELFKGNKSIEALVLFGQNSEKIKASAELYEISNIFMAKDLEEAMNIVKTKNFKSKIILFSPASASWGQYENFEKRGEHYKSIVESWR